MAASLAEEVLSSVAEEDEPDVKAAFDRAESSLQEGEKAAAAEETETSEGETTTAEGTEPSEGEPEVDEVKRREAKGIYHTLKDLAEKGILALVLEDGTAISNRSIADPYTMRLQDAVGIGSGEEAVTEAAATGTVEHIVFVQYLADHFSSFTEQEGATAAEDEGEESATALAYELEYILGGKTSDSENLLYVLHRILGIRTAINTAYLLTDVEKKAVCTSLATAIAGFTLNPIIIEAVDYALRIGWAYAESIADVRRLLAGEKIPVIKTASDWQTDVYHLSETMARSASNDREDSLTDISYEGYLKSLLFLQATDKSALRSLDLIEKNISLGRSQGQLRMETCVYGLSYTVSHHIVPVFAGFIGGEKFYGFDVTTSYAYET